MPKYYTHGSIENVSYDFINNRIKFYIKPLSEFEVVVDKKKYLVFVNDPERDYFGFLVNRKKGFTVSDNIFLVSVVPYWINNKIKLKFTVSEDTEDETKLRIISIEPIE
ncbi:MAG TPA: hypothetical protein GXX77_08350 [Candidatus Cloacimonetes bacterium]|nr:hypothetical protein [Candidatus Cloacimonadota bacterium]